MYSLQNALMMKRSEVHSTLATVRYRIFWPTATTVRRIGARCITEQATRDTRKGFSIRGLSFVGSAEIEK